MTMYPLWAVMLIALIAEVYGMAGKPRWWKFALMAIAMAPIFRFAGVEV